VILELFFVFIFQVPTAEESGGGGNSLYICHHVLTGLCMYVILDSGADWIAYTDGEK
jgi:hypothetical protein